MAQRIPLKQFKENVDRLERYIQRHPAFDGIENWPKPDHKDYWPLRWLMEYLLIVKNEYYRRSARKKMSEKKKRSRKK